MLMEELLLIGVFGGSRLVFFIDSVEVLEDLVIGSALLGGGGGGDLEAGLQLARMIPSLGVIEIRSIDEVSKDSILVTTSIVGPQSDDTWKRFSLIANIVRSVRAIDKAVGIPIEGLISSEIGALNTISPFSASIFLDIPVIDAPCNGRAHPTVLMGSLGLHRRPGYRALIAASWGVAGDRSRGSAILMGSLEEVVSILRGIVMMRGSVATARNPVEAEYVKHNAAPGSVSLAIDLGSIITSYRSDPRDLSHKIANRLSGLVIEDCVAVEKLSEVREGLDYGRVSIRCGDKEYVLVYANEYIYLEDGGSLVALFPDLISTIDISSGLPLLSKDLDRGSRFNIIITSWKNLRLGSGLRYPESYEHLVKAIEIDIRPHLKELLVG